MAASIRQNECPGYDGSAARTGQVSVKATLAALPRGHLHRVICGLHGSASNDVSSVPSEELLPFFLSSLAVQDSLTEAQNTAGHQTTENLSSVRMLNVQKLLAAVLNCAREVCHFTSVCESPVLLMCCIVHRDQPHKHVCSD